MARRTPVTEQPYAYRDGTSSGARGLIHRMPHPPKCGSRNRARSEDCRLGIVGSCRGDNDRVERIFRRERDENTVGVVEGALEVFD